MKTAVIISGQARTFDICFPSQRWQVYRHYEPDLHFFVTVKDDEDSDKMEVLRQYSKNVSIQKLPDPEEGDLWMPSEDAGRFAPYANAAGNRQLMLQHWGNKEAWKFFLSNGGNTSFNTIIRIRTDSFFHGFKKPYPEWHEGGIYPGTIFTPWWGRFGGINDRFAIMGLRAAETYFCTYDMIPDLLDKGCPFHPESLVAAALELGEIGTKCHYEPLHATFSTIRKNGQQRPPEIMLEDLADLSL